METNKAFNYVFSKKNPKLKELSAEFHPRFKMWKFRLKKKLISEIMKEKILKELGYECKQPRQPAQWQVNK